MGDNRHLNSVSRALQSAKDNLIIALKVVIFVVSELGAFPLFCGVLLDFCTLPVFGSTIYRRYLLYNAYPNLFLLLHWIIGSTFMYHFAIYVGVVREIIRPGVLWFIRDPNDPQFNAMRDIISRPVLSQIRKLLIGVVLYGSIIIGIVGGSIQTIAIYDYVIDSYLGKSVFKILPLRLEFYDSMSEIPFDLFFLQYIFPHILKLVDINSNFKSLVRTWFETVARKLRVSHFLLGEDHPDEQSDFGDFEDEAEVRYLTIDDPFAVRGPGEEFSDETDEEWENIDEVHVKKSTREKRYLRVPNRDTVEIIPGDRMVVWMKEEDPVFGRPNETADDIQTNWTKVYAPDWFQTRVSIIN